MKITIKDVEYVAKLARLELTEAEKDNFARQLESILGYIDKLNELDTRNIQPTSHALNITNVMREDIMVKCPENIRNNILNNAPERESDFFRVKKVIE